MLDTHLHPSGASFMQRMISDLYIQVPPAGIISHVPAEHLAFVQILFHLCHADTPLLFHD